MGLLKDIRHQRESEPQDAGEISKISKGFPKKLENI